MDVGLVCPYDLSAPGGVQAQVMGLYRTLGRCGDSPYVIGPGLPEGTDGLDLGPAVKIPANGSLAPISIDPTVGRRMRRACSDLDVLHVHEPFMPMVSILALRAGPPVVGTFHADPGALGKTVYKVLGRRARVLLGESCRGFSAVSRVAAAHLPLGLEVEIVPNGVETGVLRRADVPRVLERVVFLGRDEPRKGLDVLLQAWSWVEEAVPEAELVVMGAERDLPGIDWMGPVDDDTKTEILSSAGVYVAPNLRGESFGVVLVEAMAAGAAVVASDLDAFVDVGGDAVLYFRRGDPADLARALVDVLTDPARRASLATRGTVRAREFDWDVVTHRYRGLYERARM